MNQNINVDLDRNNRGKPVLGREKHFYDQQPQQQMECPNCRERLPMDQIPAHTVQCYRNSTKCKVCGEIIQKTKKKEHLERWRKLDLLIRAIEQDNDEEASLFFDHGLDPNI